MSYYFQQSDTSVERGVRRIAVEQIDKAISEIQEPDVTEAVHNVRKRCKKLRALIRIVRYAFDDYKAENASFRDAARSLAVLRDAEIVD